MAVQEYDLDIRHRSGKSNRALSRNPVPVFSVLQFGPAINAVQPGQCESDIGLQQRADEELLPIFNYLENDILPSDEKQARKLALEGSNFEVIERVLYYDNPAVPGCWRIAVPMKERKIRCRTEDLYNLAN